MCGELLDIQPDLPQPDRALERDVLVQGAGPGAEGRHRTIPQRGERRLASDAWAVGNFCSAHCADNTETDATLILHWDGTRWSVG
jgi:hypothetical protein